MTDEYIVKFKSEDLTNDEITFLDKIGFEYNENISTNDFIRLKQMLEVVGERYIQDFKDIVIADTEYLNPYFANDQWHNWFDAIVMTKESFLKIMSDINLILAKRDKSNI